MFPDSASLYVKRGKLYLHHGQFSKSLKDLKKSKLLNYNSFEQNFLIAQVYYKIGDYYSAEIVCNKLLEFDKQNVSVLNLKAHNYLTDNKFVLAAKSFEEVINYSVKTFPNNYLNAAEAWEMTQTESGYHNAVTIIQQGINDLGSLVTLNKELIRMYLKSNNFSEAIKIQLNIIEQSTRKETPYYELSQIYRLKGNSNKSFEYLVKARKRLYKLPKRIQYTTAMKELLIKIDADLINHQ